MNTLATKMAETFIAFDKAHAEWEYLLHILGTKKLKEMLPSLEVEGVPRYVGDMARALRKHLKQELPVDRTLRLVKT